MKLHPTLSLFLGLATAATALAMAPKPKSVPLADQLGLQLYSVRASFSQDPFKSMDMVASYGIKEVETAGTSGMTPQAFRAELEKRGLRVTSSHVQYNNLRDDLAKVVAEVKALGAGYAVVPWIPHEGQFDHAAAEKAAADFIVWGEAFAKEGIKFAYHPHGYEFGGGKMGDDTPFDRMAKATAGKNVMFEMDVFWVVHGGADPFALLEKYKGRWMGFHVKDIRKGAPIGKSDGRAPAEDKVVVGTGQVDWPKLIAAAKAQGMQHFYIEDESPDPLRNIPLSLAYLRTLKL